MNTGKLVKGDNEATSIESLAPYAPRYFRMKAGYIPPKMPRDKVLTPLYSNPAEMQQIWYWLTHDNGLTDRLIRFADRLIEWCMEQTPPEHVHPNDLKLRKQLSYKAQWLHNCVSAVSNTRVKWTKTQMRIWWD